MNLETKPRRRVRSLWALMGIAALALLASCGGGSLENPYTPTRIVAFGDETSVITSDGHQYTVNYVDPTTLVLNCTVNPNWVQYLAQAYGLYFSGCNTVTGPSVMHAVAGARATSLSAQVDAHLASDTFSRGDLVTVLIGAHDILDEYLLTRSGTTIEAAQAELAARGTTVANQVLRIVAAGGKVLISTVQDQGLTPYAAVPALNNDAALLTSLTQAFNTQLRLSLVNASGRDVGLVLGDELVRRDVNFPGSYGYSNDNNPACLSADPDPNAVPVSTCTTVTVQPNIDPNTWLWADYFHLGPQGQRELGDQALYRARNNPF